MTDCIRHRYGIRKIFNQFIEPINRRRHNNRRFIRKTFVRRCIVFNDYVIIFKVNFCLVYNLYKRVIFVRIFYYNRKFIRAVPTNLIAYFQIAKLLNCFRIAVQECHINEIVHIELSFVIIFRVTDFTAILNVSNSYEIKLKIIVFYARNTGVCLIVVSLLINLIFIDCTANFLRHIDIIAIGFNHKRFGRNDETHFRFFGGCHKVRYVFVHFYNKTQAVLIAKTQGNTVVHFKDASLPNLCLCGTRTLLLHRFHQAYASQNNKQEYTRDPQ